jgi:beta-phosphoglucomutase-like phosphatase (HAD superfamily)
MLVPEWKIHRRIGMSGRSLVHQLVCEHGLRFSKIDIEQLEKKHDTVFNKSTTFIQPLPGTEKLLRPRPAWWAIATTGGKGQTKKLVRMLRIPARTVVVTGDDVAKAAIQEKTDGKVVDWMEKVSDEQYRVEK